MSESGKLSDADACRDVLLTVMRECDQEALAHAGGYLFRYVREETVLRDCGQHGVCRTPPGCARHWEERNRELVRQIADLSQLAEERLAHANQLQSDIEAEQNGRIAARKRFGATNDETMVAFIERLVRERDDARAAIDAISDELDIPRGLVPAPGELRRFRDAAKAWWAHVANNDGAVPADVHERGWQWRPKTSTTACGRCAAAETSKAPHE